MRLGFGLLALVAMAAFVGLLSISHPADTTAAIVADSAGQAEPWTALLVLAVTAGLCPTVLAIYFWLIRTEKAALLAGLPVVLVSALIHYVLAAFMAHSGSAIALAIAVVELLACAAVLVAAHLRFRPGGERTP